MSAQEQYERSFRRNRDSAVEDGYDLICPICGCSFNGDDDEWDMSHDGSLHRLYDALTQATSSPPDPDLKVSA